MYFYVGAAANETVVKYGQFPRNSPGKEGDEARIVDKI